MNVDMQTQTSCCCPMKQTQNSHVEASSSRHFSSYISFASMTTYINPSSGRELSAEQAMAASTSQQSLLQNLPNVSQHLKPWYFPDAQNHNVAVIRTTAFSIVSNHSNSNELNLQTIIDALKRHNNVFEAHDNCCQSNNMINANDSEILSNNDQCQLEKMHYYAEENHIDTNCVNSIAAQLASDKLSAKNQDLEPPELSKNYFDDIISGMNFWKNTFHGNQIVNHLSGFFS